MQFLPLLLIPLCALLNHLAGQSTTIPDPRITCRVFGIGAAFGVAAYLAGISADAALYGWAVVTAGMAVWAVPSNGEEFMALTGQDKRDYTKYEWIAAVCDRVVGVTPSTTLTLAQCRNWGTMYGTVLGTFLFPMFGVLAFLLTPWAALIGLTCLLQGLVYRYSSTVLKAEWKWGAVIGAMLAGTILITIL